MEQPLEQLLAKQSISEALYRYCRAMDRMDRDLALGVWHDGGTAEYPPHFDGTGSGFVAWVWDAHSHLAYHSHQITNILIELVGPDAAVSEAYVTVVLHSPPNNGEVFATTAQGRYLDRWSRRDGRWAIDHRRFMADVSRTDAVAIEATYPSGFGARDRTDPSYALRVG